MANTTQKMTVRAALEAASETRALELGRDTLKLTPQIFRQQFGDKTAQPIADPRTFAAAGEQVVQAFRQAGIACATPLILTDPELYAEYRFLAPIEAVLQGKDAIPVVIGSGTLNDLTKLASHRAGRSYLVVATAASMDGYTAFGASITYQGAKQTFTCPAPQAVVADLNVIAAAPPVLNASGYADLLAKTAAGADWQVADALEVEKIDDRAWSIVQGGLREALAHPAGIPAGDLSAIGPLAEGLMMGGFAMQWTRSSRTASGAEHQFSHLWDMQHHTHQGQAPSHGFKVGIGTLGMVALYEFLLSQPLERLDPDRCCAEWPDQKTLEKLVCDLLEPGDVRTVALRETAAKWIAPAELRRQLDQLRTVWPELRQRLRVQLPPFTQVKAMLQAAGAPTEPEQIGISRQRLRVSFRQAYLLRRRFTGLDLAVRTALFEPALVHLFGPQGPWPIA